MIERMVRPVRALAGRLTPPLVGLVSALSAALFCLVRLARLGGGAGTFIVAGQPFTDPATVPGDIPVLASGGFDGQFFYRLALDPATVGMGRSNGISFDYGVRGGRIGYPLLSWIASLGGRPSLVPAAMIVVNVVAVGLLAWIAAHLALDHGRAAVWGFAIAGYWGFGIVLGRDLAELVAAAAVFGVIMLVGRGRYWWAGVVGVVAVSTREQAVLTVAMVAVGVALVEWRRAGAKPALRAALQVSLLPAVAFVTWQGLVARVIGEFPATSSSRYNSTWPLRSFPSALRGWADDAVDAITRQPGVGFGSLLPILCFAGLVLLVGTAVTSDGLRVAWVQRPWEVLVGAAAIYVILSSTIGVLEVPADFRQSADVAGCSWLVIWASSGRRRHIVLAAVAPLTLLVLGFRCLVL